MKELENIFIEQSTSCFIYIRLCFMFTSMEKGWAFLMEDLKIHVKNVIDGLELVCNDLYKQEQRKAYDKLNIVLGDLTELINEIGLIEGFDLDKLMSNLTQALKAMEELDYILLSDILKYEVVEQLTTIL